MLVCTACALLRFILRSYFDLLPVFVLCCNYIRRRGLVLQIAALRSGLALHCIQLLSRIPLQCVFC